ncbi:MAG: hypothetical protein K8R73_04145 [Clostridiales bacterium]|nr:hypothetical protein [Clostridiales bacterium]
MKKGIVLTLLIALLALSNLTFADTSVENVRVQERGNRIEQDKGESKEIWRTNITEVINTYVPELLADYTSAWAEHDAIHIELQTIRTAAQENNRLEIEAIIAKATAKEITFAETRELLKAHHESNKADRETIRAEIEALKAVYGHDPEVVKSTVDTLKAAIETEETDTIITSLYTLLEMLEQHIQFDQMKLELLDQNL